MTDTEMEELEFTKDSRKPQKLIKEPSASAHLPCDSCIQRPVP